MACLAVPILQDSSGTRSAPKNHLASERDLPAECKVYVRHRIGVTVRGDASRDYQLPLLYNEDGHGSRGGYSSGWLGWGPAGSLVVGLSLRESTPFRGAKGDLTPTPAHVTREARNLNHAASVLSQWEKSPACEVLGGSPK